VASWQARGLAQALRFVRLFPPNMRPETVRRYRARFELRARAFPRQRDVKITPDTVAGLAARWHEPADHVAGRLLLYLHGGAYVIGSPTTHEHLVARMSHAARARGLAIDYRLAPEFAFPAALEDVVRVVKHLYGEGVDSTRLVLAGDSAGGGLCLATLLALRDEGAPLPAAAVVLSPWTDLTFSGRSHVECARQDPYLSIHTVQPAADAYRANEVSDHPLVSPRFADFKGLPPLLIHVGTREILLDDARMVAERARAAGVDVTLHVGEGLVHVWHYFTPMLPEARDAIAAIGAFVAARA
jgi:epsilon-lactone hydrolase